MEQTPERDLVPVFDFTRFERARQWHGGFATFRREVATLTDEEFAAWPIRGSYSDGWRVFPLRMPEPPPGLAADIARNRDRCPASAALLSDPKIVNCGFSRLLPGCHIYPHEDGPPPDVLRFHLGLQVNGPAGMRIAGRTLQWREGEAVVFDHGCVHEAGNLSGRTRDVLLVDFELTAAERAMVAQLRRDAATSR
ncbi:MAG: aspartyl/asparaginyl beta-hydroxylase domain-containing protein [Planctomycetota bacterium]